MDQQSQEELRVYSLLQELPNCQYHENDLKEIFGFKEPLNSTRLYKYIHLEPKDFNSKMFTILKGELVTGDRVAGRKPILRGRYKITAVIDGVPFVYVKKRKDGENGRQNTISKRERSAK